MKHLLLIVTIFAVMTPPQLHAENAGGGKEIKKDKRPVKVVAVAPAVEIEEPPQFINPKTLDFFAAIGIPYDLFFTRGKYYLNRDTLWYRAANYRGPWVAVDYKQLPASMRKHDYRKIIKIRDEEYENYLLDEGYFRGRSFKPSREQGKKQKRTQKMYGEVAGD